jgi:hypothetical protein
MFLFFRNLPGENGFCLRCGFAKKCSGLIGVRLATAIFVSVERNCISFVRSTLTTLSAEQELDSAHKKELHFRCDSLAIPVIHFDIICTDHVGEKSQSGTQSGTIWFMG